MQCVNCHFENMPGIATCSRCGSALTFGNAYVEPPRASKYRTSTRVQRLFHPVWNRLAGIRIYGRRLTLLLPVPISVSALMWSIVPGLGHLRMRQRKLGWLLLSIWLTLLLLTFLSLGTSPCFFFWNGAIVTHVVALVSLFASNLSYERLLTRALFGAIIFATLYLVLYRPLTYVSTRFYVLMPIPSIGANAVVRQGDVLLYEGPWVRPEQFSRGDLVVYRINAQERRGYYIQAGFNCDRIIGVPGDRVWAVGGTLFVNGQRLSGDLRPLGSSPLGDFNVTVQSGHYLILPTCLGVRNVAVDGPGRGALRQMLESASVVDHEDVLGRIVLRLRPLNSFGSVR